jgi:hypothetical protein
MARVPGFEWLGHLTDHELARLQALVELECSGLELNDDELREMVELERVAKERMRPVLVIESPPVQRLANRVAMAAAVSEGVMANGSTERKRPSPAELAEEWRTLRCVPRSQLSARTKARIMRDHGARKYWSMPA